MSPFLSNEVISGEYLSIYGTPFGSRAPPEAKSLYGLFNSVLQLIKIIETCYVMVHMVPPGQSLCELHYHQHVELSV
jgi:hypothetical protein